MGRKTTGGEYTRIDIPCPNHTHIWSRGYVDVLLHRLIYYAHYGFLPESVDHIEKNIKYTNALSNLRESDSFHNRWNVENISGKFRGIDFRYGYYWAIIDKTQINENGFISEILAVDYRNKYIIRMFLERYGHLENFPEKALDKIDDNELFLDQMIQESIEKTETYKLKQLKIKNKRQLIKKKQRSKYKQLTPINAI